MKQIASIVALLTILALETGCFQSGSASKNDFTVGETGILAYYTGKKNIKLHIPGQIGAVKVTAIGLYTFSDQGLTGLTLPEGITAIADGAFRNNNLTSLTIPHSVTVIGDKAFDNNKLVSVTIGNNVILNTAFNNSLDHFYNVNGKRAGVYVIRNGRWWVNPVFDESKLNTSDFIIDGTGTITHYTGLSTSIAVPSRAQNIPVKAIGRNAFRETSLISVIIQPGVTSIGWYAFFKNELVSVVIPYSVISIGANSFRNNHLTSITIPESVTFIGRNAFSNNKLASITIGPNVSLASGIRHSFDDNFDSFYKNNGRKAGTYELSDGQWEFKGEE